jgi:hypothetical protein
LSVAVAHFSSIFVTCLPDILFDRSNPMIIGRDNASF